MVTCLSCSALAEPAPALSTETAPSTKRMVPSAAAPAAELEKGAPVDNTGLSEQQVRDTAQELVSKGEEAIKTALGFAETREGLQSSANVEVADYSPALENTTITSMKKEIKAVFTPKTAKKYYAVCFEGADPVYKEQDGKLLFNHRSEAVDFCVEWKTDTAVIMRQTVDEIMVEVDTVCNDSDPEKENLYLKKIDGRWLLDTMIVALPE